ncbi:MAG: hypothetical protein ABIB55_01085 [Candidatus Nealsonbacteria bacterium]
MILTLHILTGAAIITLVQNPILGLFFVLSSHYLLDILPHTKYTIKNIQAGQWSRSLSDFLKVFFDMFLGITIVFFIIGRSPLILASLAVTLFPDGLTFLYYIFPTNKLLERHKKIHKTIHIVGENKKIPVFWGIISQVIVIVAAIYLLLQQQILP